MPFHYILDVYGVDEKILDDLENLKKMLHEAADALDSEVLGVMEKKFEPQGVSVILMLAESHISIHTWPETGYAAIDLFTCDDSADPEEGKKVILKYLQPKKVFENFIFRKV